MADGLDAIRKKVRDIPDFPKPGIIFKDITPLLCDAENFQAAIQKMAEPFRALKVDKVVCIEARGFILGAPVAMALGAGIVPVRKPRKLPYKTICQSYALEYGTDTLEMHEDAIVAGEKILIVDDVLATGGTMGAVVQLVKKMKGTVAGVSFLLELDFLKGREKLKDEKIFSLLHY